MVSDELVTYVGSGLDVDVTGAGCSTALLFLKQQGITFAIFDVSCGRGMMAR